MISLGPLVRMARDLALAVTGKPSRIKTDEEGRHVAMALRRHVRDLTPDPSIAQDLSDRAAPFDAAPAAAVLIRADGTNVQVEAALAGVGTLAVVEVCLLDGDLVCHVWHERGRLAGPPDVRVTLVADAASRFGKGGG